MALPWENANHLTYTVGHLYHVSTRREEKNPIVIAYFLKLLLLTEINTDIRESQITESREK